MKGKHYIDIIGRNFEYHVSLERKITILQGYSATGKSHALRLIEQFMRNRGRVGYEIRSSASLRFLNTDLAITKYDTAISDNVIFLADEGLYYLHSIEFAKAIQASRCYFLLITRDVLPTLPYSYKSILKLDTSSHAERFVTSTEELYSEPTPKELFGIITEDSNSGRQMLCKCSERVLDSPVWGNSTLYPRAYGAMLAGAVLVFADGAALGPYMKDLMELYEQSAGKLSIWAPESFEWLLLKSGVVYRSDVKEILENTADYVEAADYTSWEQFFTSLVTEIMSAYPGHEYSKSRLRDWYLSEENVEKFKSVIPEEIRNLL